MTTKRGLITDSFTVVKKSKRGRKRKESPTPPPPLQAEDVSTTTVREEELQKLKQFDLDWTFGPCTGITRLQRWERAKLHGLNPSEEVRELLLEMHADPEFSLSLWNEYPF